MLIEPGVEVKNVVDQPPPQANWRGADLGEEGRPDAQVGRRMFPGQAPCAGQRQGRIVVINRHPWPSDIESHSLAAALVLPLSECVS
jgi:hypothetical protein